MLYVTILAHYLTEDWQSTSHLQMTSKSRVVQTCITQTETIANSLSSQMLLLSVENLVSLLKLQRTLEVISSHQSSHQLGRDICSGVNLLIMLCHKIWANIKAVSHFKLGFFCHCE